jgi:hypothetical protein
LRSLPLPVSPPLPVIGADGRLLNDPGRPYWGRYEGDENIVPQARVPQRHGVVLDVSALLRSAPIALGLRARSGGRGSGVPARERLLAEGCLGISRDPGRRCAAMQRGCDAQAWSVTEALRV